MLKIKSLILMASAAIMMSGTSVAQNCNSCGGGNVNAQFGYPASVGDCGCSGQGGRFSSHHERMDQLRAENAKITARNDAWPKPFACGDRQLYHQIWTPMIDQGFEEQCLLSSEHFDAETNELNSFGVSAVAGIMQNMPTARKNVYVSRDSNEAISQSRLGHVNQFVNTMYGQMAPNAQVAFSFKTPSSVTGIRAEAISQKFIQSAPIPIIPIATGKQSVSSSVGN